VLVCDAYKTFTHGTHRAYSPERTYAAVQPFMAAMGITRVAGLTGLDRTGVPVYMASRPNSRSLAVTQGKGLSDAAARTSALMEAVESWHAEQAPRELLYGNETSLHAQRPLPGVALALCKNSPYHEYLDLNWVRAIDLNDGGERLVPFELVHSDFTMPGPDPVACFSASTNGLASGNSIAEAAIHAVCELIERDATTLWHLRQAPARSAVSIKLASVDDPDCVDLLARFDDAGLDVVVWDVSTDINVACFHALIVDRHEVGGIPEFGSGCHPSRAIALTRALTEAAQARTTYIAGARDDFDPRWYDASTRKRRWRACHQLFLGAAAKRHFHAAPDVYHDNFDTELEWLTVQLSRAGISELAYVDLSCAEFGTAVVRVVAAGLEGPLTGALADYVHGTRGAPLRRAGTAR